MSNYLFYYCSIMIIALIFPHEIWEKNILVGNLLSEMSHVYEITMATDDVTTIWCHWWCHIHILCSFWRKTVIEIYFGK